MGHFYISQQRRQITKLFKNVWIYVAFAYKTQYKNIKAP
jgi:hypothetical protein